MSEWTKANPAMGRFKAARRGAGMKRLLEISEEIESFTHGNTDDENELINDDGVSIFNYFAELTPEITYRIVVNNSPRVELVIEEDNNARLELVTKENREIAYLPLNVGEFLAEFFGKV